MRFPRATLVVASSFAIALAASIASSGDASATERHEARPGPGAPWCAPEVRELSDHVCYFDGGTPENGRHTLVIYLHGMLADAPGFQWLQQRAMAIHAKRLGFTVLLPTSPKDGSSYVWPTSQTAIAEKTPAIAAEIARERRALVATVGHDFDETFIVGFSSGAYYGSVIALRGSIPSDGSIILVGGSAWARPDPDHHTREPIYVGVAAGDPQTRDHSRAYGATLATLGWPHRMEEASSGHMVDWGLITRGVAWLRAQKAARNNL